MVAAEVTERPPLQHVQDERAPRSASTSRASWNARHCESSGLIMPRSVSPEEFASNDPFILLADDRLELRDGQPAGGPHPHAGFETVTFMLEGSIHGRDEGVLEAGGI